MNLCWFYIGEQLTKDIEGHWQKTFHEIYTQRILPLQILETRCNRHVLANVYPPFAFTTYHQNLVRSMTRYAFEQRYH